VAEDEAAERVDQHRGDGRVPMPPVIRGHDPPRRLLGAAAREESSPPALGRVLDPLPQTLALLVLADVKKELEDDGPLVGGEEAIDRVDVLGAWREPSASPGPVHPRHDRLRSKIVM